MTLYEALIEYVEARIEYEFSQRDPDEDQAIRESDTQHLEKTKTELKTICDSVALMFFPKRK